MELTDRQESLQTKSEALGPIYVFGSLQGVARKLESLGLGKITSNPGADYNGPAPDRNRPYGGFYVANNWSFDQSSKTWKRN